MQWFRQTKTLIWVTVLAAHFPDAEAVGAVPADLVTTKKSWLAAPTEANFFRCTFWFLNTHKSASNWDLKASKLKNS
jgi:hypothetical protein